MKLLCVEEKWTFSGPYPRSKTRELTVRVFVMMDGLSVVPSRAMHAMRVQRVGFLGTPRSTFLF